MTDKQQPCIRIFVEQEGRYVDTGEEFLPEEFGGIPAVNDVIVSPGVQMLRDGYEHEGGFWEVVKRYFKPDVSKDPLTPSYVILVVVERSRVQYERPI